MNLNIMKAITIYNLSLGKLFVLGGLLLGLPGCSKTDANDSFLKQLNGRYVIVSAKSDIASDVNQDGVSSTNLLTEIPELKSSFLELIAKGEGPYIFSLFWQNQYFQGTNLPPQNFDPSVIVQYMNQATVADFTVDKHHRNLMLSRSIPDTEFPLPTSVEILDNQNIRISMFKHMYTTSGWINLDITIEYKKIDSSL